MRTAIISGGTAGIGFAVAQALLRRGHRAYIFGRDKGRLDNALRSLGQISGGRVAGGICDVRDPASCSQMAEKAAAAFDRLDVLVNNAGIGFVRHFDEISHEQWRDVIDTNLTGVFNCCKAVLPLLRKAGGGDIVNMGSRSGRYSFAGGTPYNATKFALQGFTEALFLDLCKENIRVSLVAPGTVSTGFGGAAPESWHLTAEDVGKVVADVVESEAGACVNWVELRPSRPR